MGAEPSAAGGSGLARRWWGGAEQVTLPARGSAQSALWDGLASGLLSTIGGLLMIGLAPLVAARGAMLAAGVGAVLVGGYAWAVARSPRPWTRSLYTVASAGTVTLGTAAAEHGSALRLGPVALLCPVLVIACFRSGREVAWQVLASQAVFGTYLFLTLPWVPALVGLLAGATVMAMLAAVISALRGRLDAVLADLRRQALTDPLTGLLNRTGLREAVAAARAAEGAVLLLDLDRFKQVNDQHGHEVGDAVLSWLAELLRLHTRSGDVVARYGGEEFVVYLPGPGDVTALRGRAEHLRRQVETSSRDRGLPMTVSIGVAHGPADDLPGLLRAADVELYAAKHAGRNLVRIA